MPRFHGSTAEPRYEQPHGHEKRPLGGGDPIMSTILVIEDSQDNFDLIADALDDGHVLVHAETGLDGLAKAQALHPDLILLDMGLPEMDGWEVARRLKANSALATIPTVALTAHAMHGDRDKCLQAGCDSYVPKPVNVRDLVALVRRYVGSPGACATS